VGKYARAEPSVFNGRDYGAGVTNPGPHKAGHVNGKNPGDVWSMATANLRQAHFAAYPIGIPAVHGLEVDDPDRHAEYAVACPVPAGGCTMHASYTLHYAGPNTSPRPRRAYILIFRAPATTRDHPVDNYWMREKRTARAARANAATSSAGSM
jgi:hypothetical protein